MACLFLLERSSYLCYDISEDMFWWEHIVYFLSNTCMFRVELSLFSVLILSHHGLVQHQINVGLTRIPKDNHHLKVCQFMHQIQPMKSVQLVLDQEADVEGFRHHPGGGSMSIVQSNQIKLQVCHSLGGSSMSIVQSSQIKL